jgi:streptogramin lyase
VRLIVDGSNLGKIGREGRFSLAQLRSAIAALREQHPKAEITAVVDANQPHKLEGAEAGELRAAERAGEVVLAPSMTPGAADRVVLELATQSNGAVVSNDAFSDFVEEYPWLYDGDRLLGATPSGNDVWAFTPRTLPRPRPSEQQPPALPPEVRTVPVGEGPSSVAAAFGFLWVANHDSSTVTRLALGGDVGPVVQLSVGAAPVYVAAGAGSIWVSNELAGSVTRLAPDGALVLEADCGRRPFGLAHWDGLVFVASRESESIVALDDKSGEPMGGPIELDFEPFELALDGDSLWVIGQYYDAGALCRVNAATRELEDPPVRIGDELMGLAIDADGDFVWIADSARGLFKLARHSGELVDCLEMDGELAAVAVGHGVVWATDTLDGTVLRLDRRTGEPLAPPVAVGPSPCSIAVAENAVWVANCEANTATRIAAPRI